MSDYSTADASGSTDVFLQTYHDQLARLEADPNATQEYKDILEHHFETIRQHVLGQGGTSGADTAAPDESTVSCEDTEVPENTGSSPADAGILQGDNVPEALKQWSDELQQASEATGVPVEVLAGMLWQESRGDNGAATVNGGNGLTDGGLMQVNSATFAELQQKHPELQGRTLDDPETNIEAAAYYLKDLQEQFGSEELALRAYNSGPLSVDVNDPNVTTTGLGDPTYVEKVGSFAEILRTGGTLPA